MKVTRPTCCVAHLRQGQIKRVPTALWQPLLGFYIGCPSCGIASPVLASEQTFEEGETLSMRPGHRCGQCKTRFRIINDVLEVLG